jgi:hypothetical protein
MLVKWNGVGPLSIGDPRPGSNYKMAAVIVLTPGVNKLEDEVWKRSAENPQIKRLIKLGKKKGGLEIVTDVMGDKEQAAAAKKAEDKQIAIDLSGFADKEAADIVRKTLNKELLEQWAESDNRPLVRRAVEKQLKTLTIKPKKDADGADEPDADDQED